MLKLVKPNLVESEKGFSVEVKYLKIMYKQEQKVLTVQYEPLVSPEFNMLLYTNEIKKWDSGFDIDENERKTVIDNIFLALPLLGIKARLPRNF